MTNLSEWYAGIYPRVGVFRTADFRIWYDFMRKDYCVAYRSPLFARLPVRRFADVGIVAWHIGEGRDIRNVKGTIKR